MPKKIDQMIREEDVQSRNIERRTFLGRLGTAAGLLAWTAACAQDDTDSQPTDTDSQPTDTDSQPSDSDSSDSDSSDSDNTNF